MFRTLTCCVLAVAGVGAVVYSVRERTRIGGEGAEVARQASQQAVAAGVEPVFQLPTRPAPPTSLGTASESPNLQEILELRSLAFDIAERTVQKLPDNPVALALLGKLHLRSNNPEVASALWNHAIALDPGSVEPHLDYGHLELNLGNYAAAETHLRRARECDAESLDVYPPLIESLLSQSKFSDAVPYLEFWLQREPRSEMAHNQLGRCHQELGNYEEAIESFSTALQINPMSRAAAMGLMTVQRARGEREKSAEAAQLFAAIDAQDLRALPERDVVDRDREKMEESLLFTVRSAVEILLKERQLLTAIAHLEEVTSHLPEADDLRIQLADLHAARGRPDKAISLLREPCQRSPENANAWMALAITTMKSRQLDTADEALRQVIRLRPDDDEAYRLRAQTQMAQQRDLPGALASAQRALELSPSAANHYILGTAFYHLRNFEAARAELYRALELEPNNAEFQRALAAIP